MTALRASIAAMNGQRSAYNADTVESSRNFLAELAEPIV